MYLPEILHILLLIKQLGTICTVYYLLSTVNSKQRTCTEDCIQEVACKLKKYGLAKKVFGFAITGSFKGFEVLSEA